MFFSKASDILNSELDTFCNENKASFWLGEELLSCKMLFLNETAFLKQCPFLKIGHAHLHDLLLRLILMPG